MLVRLNPLTYTSMSFVWCPLEGFPEPGALVKDIRDRRSFGMVLGVMRTDQRNELLVLWSIPPTVEIDRFA